MSLPRSAIARTASLIPLRQLHTGGRQIPNPGQGGATPQTTISPSSTLNHSLPSLPSSSSAPNPDAPHDLRILHGEQSSHPHRTLVAPSTRRRAFTPKGKLIPHRPARTIPVTLPSGYPEPSTYPPPAEYFVDLESKKTAPHPLWQFFHVDPTAKEVLKSSSDKPVWAGALIDEGDGIGQVHAYSGRAWSASELRQKSFADLHTLWYILLKERNLIMTQRTERGRAKVSHQEGGIMLSLMNLRCRKSMARIKYVLNERRLGLIAAANPHLNRASPRVPFSSSASNDPVAAVEALRGLNLGGVQTIQNEGKEVFVAEVTTPVVTTGEVAKQEVESRDEVFGGEKEAEEFVRDVNVEGRHVEKRA